MNVLITGSAGFIATNLALYLKQTEYTLFGIDSLLSSSANLRFTESFVNHFVLDINDTARLEEVFSCHNFDAVIHLAALGNVVDSIQDPLKNFNNNLNTTLLLLEMMRKYEVKNIIFSSTGGALMGRPDKLPVSESTAPNPISPYGASKMACEGYLSAYADSFDIHSIALRFGNVVGPYSGHKKGVVNKWVELLLQNRDIVIYGDGSSTRDYISVDDICQGLRLSLDAILGENLDNKFEVFHLSNNHQVSLSDLFLMLKDMTQSTSSVVYMPSRQGEVINNCATYAKAHDLLGFRPSKSLEVCLSQYVDWVKSS